MEEYLEAEDVQVNLLSAAALAYFNALSNFLEYHPTTANRPVQRRTIPELRAILHPNLRYRTPTLWTEVAIPNHLNAIDDELRHLRLDLVNAVQLEFRFTQRIGVPHMDNIVEYILSPTAMKEFTSTLTYSVTQKGKVIYHTNDYQVANGMVLAWSMYQELVVDDKLLPLMTMSLNCQPLEGGTDIAFGPQQYHIPRTGDLYIIGLPHSVKYSEERFSYAVARDLLYLQGYASMVQWLNMANPPEDPKKDVKLWELIQYNLNGFWVDATLVLHPLPTPAPNIIEQP